MKTVIRIYLRSYQNKIHLWFEGPKRKEDIMNFEEFVDEMIREVEQRMSTEVRVKKHCASKNNGTQKVALVILRKDVNISPTIYMEEFYEQYQQGATVVQLVKTILEFYEKICVKKNINVEEIFVYENMKDKIAYKLVNAEKNREMLKNTPHEEFLDLAMICYLILDDPDLGTASVNIGREHLRHWGITERELFEQAKKNTPILLPHIRMELTEVMFVHTNDVNQYGAAVLAYPDTLKQEFECLGENFYIIPSSIHEVIIVPESFGMNRIDMEVMLRTINVGEVREEEVLSDHVYYYIGREEKIIL